MFSDLISRQLLSTYYTLGMISDAWDTVVSKTDQVLGLLTAHFTDEETKACYGYMIYHS